MVFLWFCNGFAKTVLGFAWCFAMVLLWCCDGFAIVLLWFCYGVAIVLFLVLLSGFALWLYYDFAAVVYGFVMFWLRCCYEARIQEYSNTVIQQYSNIPIQ